MNAQGTAPASDNPSVGIVVVSHSRALAKAALGLASEMLHGRPLRIELAAGLDATSFGTDAAQVKTAIEAMDGPAGVVVLMDLGSAVLSAELALDLLDDQTMRERVVLSAAPIVEGLVVAAVAASGGASKEEVAAEAQAALLGKRAHLDNSETAAEQPGPTDTDVTGTFTVGNAHGLHARPAARLVSEVNRLDATVTLTNLTTGAGPVPAASLSRVATLGAEQGHQLRVAAAGPQAKEAVDHVVALAARQFDETESDGPPRGPATQTRPATGPVGVSPGIAIGPLRRFAAPEVDVVDTEIGEPGDEWRRVVEAIARVRKDIEHVRALTVREVGEDEAAIFDAHLGLLSDAEILGAVKRGVQRGEGALGAWSAALTRVENELANLSDGYLRGRAADVRAVGDQVRQVLAGVATGLDLAEGLLVARDLTPAQAAALDAERVHGVVLMAGSATSHAAILIRSRDIPLVVCAGTALAEVPDGTTLVVDGAAAEVLIDPPAQVVEQYRTRAAALVDQRRRDLASAAEPAATLDGTPVTVAANIGSVDDARTAANCGADEAGLVRTEFLFLGRDTAPSVEDQERHYAEIADALGGRRVTLRTLDVGGDKPLSYVTMPTEDNPFLGVRGLRLALEQPDLLHAQLAAISRVARRTPVNVMFPMISTLRELREARAALDRACGSDGLPGQLRVGMMVEVPAAALKVETFLPHLDFVSIGTNDLTQYTMAAERGNPGVARLSDPLDPAVLQLIDHVCRAGRGRALVAVCGEVASDPDAIPLLVGLGVQELSVAPRMVPRVKAQVRDLDVGHCAVLAKRALTLASAADVRALLG
ncbi:phosphoenolpyruvate--protein phosphotransferase [Flexivirga oryzae]|uniref:Phosphocarrier protein HPr n=1 Tax=Flexivirga oryzae TaxID=1794944 RepID=A0A839N681_9MICO|nr:phosphoenolpyruvate--protein phosphotransferase [Flexivirga oryzae]MBB2891544.1 phosphocarrier protein FPr [Flexivirga oryzae]